MKIENGAGKHTTSCDFTIFCDFRRAPKVRELEFLLEKTQDRERSLILFKKCCSRFHIFPLQNSTSRTFHGNVKIRKSAKSCFLVRKLDVLNIFTENENHDFLEFMFSG